MKFKETSANDLWNLVIGDKIGEGMSREVYIYKPDPQFVVKVEKNAGDFQNIKEWFIWQEIQFSKDIANFFAQCKSISDNGIYLVQERVTFRTIDEYPNKIPHFFTDIKCENFGFIKKQLVCCDYGSTIISKDWGTKRLRKAEWK